MGSDSESEGGVGTNDSSDDEVQRSDVDDNEENEEAGSIESPAVSRSSPSGSDDDEDNASGNEEVNQPGRRTTTPSRENEHGGVPEQQQQHQSPGSDTSDRRDDRSREHSDSEEDNERQPTTQQGDDNRPDGEDEEDPNKTTAKDIFGSDSEDSVNEFAENRDNERRRSKGSSSGDEPSSPRREGDNNNDSIDEDDEERAQKLLEGHQAMREESYRNDLMEGGEEREGEVEEVQQPEVTIEADIPRLVADLGTEYNFVKFPNFLSVETHPYDPTWYEDEIDEDEVLDEEGKGRLKLKVENTIRWRTVVDPATQEEKRESNARIVKWSDGTSSLYLGSEIFDLQKQEMTSGGNNHLFVRQGVGLQGQAVFRNKLTFRPHSTDSFTHRKMTLSLADKSQKTHKIRVLPNVGKDPEAHRSEMIKKEEDRLKASIRRENKVRRTRERAHSRGPSASYLEPDQYEEEDEDGAISLSAIKNQYKRKEFASSTYPPSDDDDGSDLEVGRRSSDKKKQLRVEESDDDD